MADREIKEAKSLRWLAVQFPKVENPKDDIDKMQNCINIYCTNAADLIYSQQAEIERFKQEHIEIDNFARNICKERMLNGKTVADFDSLQKYVNSQISESIKEIANKTNKMITEIYNKHIFGNNDLEAEEKDAIINFSDDVTYGFDNLVKEMVGDE